MEILSAPRFAASPPAAHKPHPQSPMKPAASVGDSVRFSGLIHKNHGVHLPLDVPFSLDTSGQVQRALMLKAAEKLGEGDKSHLQLYLDSSGGANPSLPGPIAIADAMTLTPTPVDTVIRTLGSTEALIPFLSATGKRFMYERARLQLGPALGWYNSPATDANLRVRMANDAARNLEWLIMRRAGIPINRKNRQQVHRDVVDGKTFNALESLAYGKRGLTEAVLVSREKPGASDDVLTRPVLEAYLKAHNLSGKEAREEFLGIYDSIDKVVAWARKQGRLETLESFSQKTVAQKPPTFWKALNQSGGTGKDNSQTPADKAQSLLEELGKVVAQLKHDPAGTGEKTIKDGKKNGFTVFAQKGDKKAKLETEPHVYLKDREERERFEINGFPAAARSILSRDTLFFHNGFRGDTPKNFIPHLLALNAKKVQEAGKGKAPSNILILENSPGGSSIVTEQIKSVIGGLDVPVDVIVQGWGASGGSKLVSMATGNRLMTPNSMILLHETRGGSGGNKALNVLNTDAADMNYSKNGYIQLIAEKTGRPVQEVRQDFKVDFWLNPVESLLYGPNGLVDAILVGPNHVITRQDVVDYIAEKKNLTPKQVNALAHAHFVERRNGEHAADLDRHDENNPLANPLQTISAVARQAKKPLAEVEGFKASAGQTGGVIDWRVAVQKPG